MPIIDRTASSIVALSVTLGAWAAGPADVVHELQTSGPYQGCTISHAIGKSSPRVLTGTCLGHTFAQTRAQGPDDLNFCQLIDGGSTISVAACAVDGRTDQIIYEVGAKGAHTGGNGPGVTAIPSPSPSPLAGTGCAAARSPVDNAVDAVVGGGQSASLNGSVLVRLTSWRYAPTAADHKGPMNGLSTQILDYGAVPALRTRGVLSAFVADALVPADGTQPMRVGGRRMVQVSCDGRVLEVELFEVAATHAQIRLQPDQLPPPAPDVLAAKARFDAQRAEAALTKDERDERRRAKIQASREANYAEAYRAYTALLADAKARRKSDPTVFGIVLGEPWGPAQDSSDCDAADWQGKERIPFCTIKTGTSATSVGQVHNECARIDENRFDTSWIISPYVDATVTDYGSPVYNIGSALMAFGLLQAAQERCFVTVTVLPDGKVGVISMPTSILGQAPQKIVTQLKDKYGDHPAVTTRRWTNGNVTSIFRWTFPDLKVTYEQQAVNAKGTAFSGGHLVVETGEWLRYSEGLEKEEEATHPHL